MGNVIGAAVNESEKAKILVQRGIPGAYGEQGNNELAGILKQLGKNWNFDMFYITELTNSPIVVTGTYMFTTYQIPDIDPVKLKNYLYEIEGLYKDNAYHSMTHGADVMNSMIYLVEHSDLIRYCTNMDMLCVILGSL